MVIHDDRQLHAVQELADEMPELSDPVFCLDQELNSLLMIAQVDALSAADAAMHGEKLLISALLGAGIDNRMDVVECISSELFVDDADLVLHLHGGSYS